MCSANEPRPQRSDALPMADRLCELAQRLGNPEDIATAYASAAMLRHLYAAGGIDSHPRAVVIATLERVRALAQAEAAAGKTEWRRALLLIDAALEELQQ